MAKVRIISKRGAVRRVNERLAAFLVHRGDFQFADEGEPTPATKPAAAPKGDDLESLTVAELRERAEGLEVEGSGAGGGVLKADLIKALKGRYTRRDMRAEE